jgi:hypothetical protein
MSFRGSHRLTILLFVTAMCGSSGLATAFPFPHKSPPPKSSRPPAAIPGPPVHADARVGDWVAYKSTGQDPVTVKKTITAVRADGVTVQEEHDDKSPAIEYSLAKEGVPAPKGKNDGAKGGEPTTKVEVIGSGKETLAIGDKKYECEWRKTRITFPATKGKKDDPVVIVRTRWVSKDVPLNGEVKSEIEIGGHTARWELAGWGRGPESPPAGKKP